MSGSPVENGHGTWRGKHEIELVLFEFALPNNNKLYNGDDFAWMLDCLDLSAVLSHLTGRSFSQVGDVINLGPSAKCASFVSQCGIHCLLRVYPSAQMLTVDIQWLKGSVQKLARKMFLQLVEYICTKLDATALRPFESVTTLPRVSTVPRIFKASRWEVRVHEFQQILFDKQSQYQNVRVLKHPEFGNTLVLDDQINMSESDLVYTESLMHKHVIDYCDSRVLILGGGDGAVLHEIIKYKPKHVTMIEIDPVVLEACRTHMRSVCGSVLDELKTDLYEIRVDDCFRALNAFQSSGHKFDVIISDLTDKPLSEDADADVDANEQCLMSKVLSDCLPLLETDGRFLTHLGGLGNREPLDRYEEILRKWPLEYKRTLKMVPSFLETYVSCGVAFLRQLQISA